MSNYQTIIDVTPIEHSSDQRESSARPCSQYATNQQAGQTDSTGCNSTAGSVPFPPFNSASSAWNSGASSTFGNTGSSSTGRESRSPFGSATFTPFGTVYTYSTTGSAAASKTGGSVVGGLAQIAIGTGLIMIGIPMLILPGPGLLAIAGGFALAANGTRKLFG